MSIFIWNKEPRDGNTMATPGGRSLVGISLSHVYQDGRAEKVGQLKMGDFLARGNLSQPARPVDVPGAPQIFLSVTVRDICKQIRIVVPFGFLRISHGVLQTRER